MNKTLFILLFLFPAMLFASIRGKVMDSQREPIPGVNIYWLNTQTGTVSDANGSFEIEEHAQINQLVFSNVSFQKDTVDVSSVSAPLEVILNENIQLREVSVVQQSPGTVKSRFTVLQTENITAHELTKAACCNLSESFETNPSVDVSYSDAATGAKQIRLLGLSGSYVQMLTENIPSLRGISSLYGMGFIPGPWMESIHVSKGTGSVVNGYEAVTGQINVEYKKPQQSELIAANVFASDAGRVEANANAGVVLSPELSTGVMLHASDELMSLDHNGDGYLDIPKVKQYNVANRWYYSNGSWVSQLFLRALTENRLGGTVAGDYKIDINTERYEFFIKNGYVFDHEKETSIGLIVSGSSHSQLAGYGLKSYDGSQQNLYLNLIYQTRLNEHQKISAGMSYNTDVYDELINVGGTVPAQRYFSRERVPGVFAEYNLHLHHTFNALVGLRADYHNQFGFFMSPRLNMRYAPSDHFTVRTTVGLGHRSPRILAENNFYLASNRVMQIDNDLKMESAWNYGLSLQGFVPLFGRELALSGEWYYTDFVNQVVIDVDSDAHAVHFGNLDGKSFAHSVQFEANMEVFRGLTMTLAHRFNDVQTTIGGELREKPLTNRYKSLATASYVTRLKKWQFDFTAQFNGGGRMPDPDPLNPLWEEEFPAHTFLLAQITKYFRTWSVYVGSENLTNFVQDNPIIDVGDPYSSNFDATNIWGPTHGRKFYVGLKWAIDRDI